MSLSCDNCDRTFESRLALDLHEDTCGADQLFCRECGERFSEASGTRDGWHYECPNDDCEGAGIGEDLVQMEKVRVTAG